MKRLTVSAIVLALMTAPVSAQVKRLKCEFANGAPSNLITIDYGAKTLTYESIDKSGHITDFAGFANLPATFTSETISAQSPRGCGMFTATLNRRSGILVYVFCASPVTSKPCTAYTAGPQKF